MTLAVGWTTLSPMAHLESPDLASPRFKQNPYPFYARLRAEAPVYRAHFSFVASAWLVTRYDDAVFVLKDGAFSNDILSQKMQFPRLKPLERFTYGDLFPRRFRVLGRHILFTDPPDHMRLRALVSKAFTPRAVERLRDRVQAVCDDLLDAAAPDGRLDLVQGFALQLPLTIIADMLGIPVPDRRRFNAWTRRVLEGAGLTLTGLALGMPALWQSERYLRERIARRRVDPQDDMVTALLQAEEAGDKLSEDEVIGMIGILLLAGFETTMGLIASGTLALLAHPEQRRRFVLDPSLTDSAIEELLRYTSPLEMGAFRVAREDVNIAGVTIPKGDMVLAVLGSANRDEARFQSPDTLDLGREPNPHLAFGAGRHFCLGASLARMEGRIAITSLFRRFPNLRLAEPVETLPWRRSLPVRCPARVPLNLRAAPA